MYRDFSYIITKQFLKNNVATAKIIIEEEEKL